MASSRLASRLNRIERSVGAVCASCASHAATPWLLFEFDGRLMDALGNDVVPAAVHPCPSCKRGGVGKIIVGVDPAVI